MQGFRYGLDAAAVGAAILVPALAGFGWISTNAATGALMGAACGASLACFVAAGACAVAPEDSGNKLGEWPVEETDRPGRTVSKLIAYDDRVEFRASDPKRSWRTSLDDVKEAKIEIEVDGTLRVRTGFGRGRRFAVYIGAEDAAATIAEAMEKRKSDCPR